MYKTLLKYLLFEVMEKWVRLGRLLHEEALASETTPASFFEGLKKEVVTAQKALLNEKAAILNLYSDKPATAKELSSLAAHIYASYQELSDLTQGVLPYLNGHPIAETNIFLKEVYTHLGDKAFKSLPAVHFHPETQLPEAFLNRAQQNILAIESLSLLHQQNPMGWVCLTQQLSKSLFSSHTAFQDLRGKLKGALSQVEFYEPLACHVISLRLLGPAYYYAAVLEALLKQDYLFLKVLEPALFQAVHHFNFSDKSLVFLHEATEKSHEFFANSPSATSLLEKDGAESLGQLFRSIEKVLPQKTAFNDKQFEKSQQLQQRLAEETLLSGANLYHEEVIRDALASKLTAKAIEEGTVPIYELLSMVTETPNSPREILNAGWLHKLERAPIWLYNTLNLSSDEEGLAKLKDLISRQDHLLIKSIETSEVHRVLLSEVVS
jgi:hypothetical protein